MIDIILDTETTGLDPHDGHRIIEIGCLEVKNFLPTGRTFHVYLNPDRDIPAEAVAVHGLTQEFLKDKPRFGDILDDFLAFIAGAQLVIHNADFDLKFLNAELKTLGFGTLKNPVLDTVKVARTKFPGQPASLDALCRRYKIDLSGRSLHGALLDAQLLADVYLELMGGRQQGLDLAADLGSSPQRSATPHAAPTQPSTLRPARSFVVPEAELAAHEKLITQLGDSAIWKKYQS